MMVRMVAGLASIGRDERLGQDQRGLGLASDLTVDGIEDVLEEDPEPVSDELADLASRCPRCGPRYVVLLTRSPTDLRVLRERQGMADRVAEMQREPDVVRQYLRVFRAKYITEPTISRAVRPSMPSRCSRSRCWRV
jgi:hypothetical protein